MDFIRRNFTLVKGPAQSADTGGAMPLLSLTECTEMRNFWTKIQKKILVGCGSVVERRSLIGELNGPDLQLMGNHLHVYG